MICGWIEVEESQEDPIAQHSGGSKVRRNRIDDVSNHVRETFLPYPIKIVEVIQPKVAAFVQTVCVEKQGAHAKNGNQLQETRTPANTEHLCNRTRRFQCFSFEVLCGTNWIRSSYGIITRMQAPKREVPFPDLEFDRTIPDQFAVEFHGAGHWRVHDNLFIRKHPIVCAAAITYGFAQRQRDRPSDSTESCTNA